MRFCIRQVGQQYAVIDRSTGQCRYIGSLDGARQVQAQLARAAS